MDVIAETDEGRESVELFNRLVESWNTRNFDEFHKWYTETIYDEDGNTYSVQDEIDEAEEFVGAISDLRFDVLRGVGTPTAAFVVWKLTGTHSNEFAGIPAQDERIDIEGTSLVRISDGKIYQTDSWFDMLEFARQAGHTLQPSG